MGLIITKEKIFPSDEINEKSLKSFQIPIFKENDNNTKSTLIENLLNEAERKVDSCEYKKSEEILQLATVLSSPRAAANLAYLNFHGLNSTYKPDYASSAAYYLIALKFIKAIPSTKWDINLVLEVIGGLTELYRFHFNYQRDLLIWNHGIKTMKLIENDLKNLTFLKALTDEEVQRIKALRISITFCLALTAEAEGKITNDYRETVNLYRDCERIGKCGLKATDKLIKKAHTKFRLLERRVPKIQPICVTCNLEVKDLKEIWNLLVCSKCQIVACCSRECLKNHHNFHK